VPVVVVVANNAGPGGATRQSAHFPPDHPERVLRFGAGVRYDRTMASFGGRGHRVDRPGQIAAALSGALADGEPTCIDVLTNEFSTAVAAI
jgi:thiamine pyrophosphate-dependent acetolactate synthase large subunit-like protein